MDRRPQRPVSGVFLFCVFLVAGQYVFAWDNPDFPPSPSFHGQRDAGLLERRDVQEAVGELCRTLRLNPANKTTQENLAAVVSLPGLTAKQRSDVFLLEGLLGYIGNLQGRADYLTFKRDLLKHLLTEKGFDGGALFQGLIDIEDYMFRSHRVFPRHDGSIPDPDNRLAHINSILSGEKERLLMRVQSLQTQYHWLKAIHKGKQYFPPQRFVRPPEIDDGPLVKSGGEIMAETAALQSEGVGKEPAAGENDKINDLSDQIVDLSLKLSETEILLDKKIEAVNALKAELADVQQRFMLEQRIIREKDEEIGSLQAALDQIQLKAASQKEELNGVIAAKDRQLMDLRVALLGASHKAEKLKKYLMETKKSLDAAGRINNIALSKDEKLIELDGILKIYKGKLAEENMAVKEKAASIAALEGQLEFLQSDLREKSETLIKTRHDLLTLENQLTAIKTELMKLRNSPEQDAPQHLDKS